MKASHLNHVWSQLIIEELARNNVTCVVISPGSRSTPLTFAAAENTKIKTVVHLEERGAAFYALGYAKATGTPAALICTSGTALANYAPAVVEASLSGTSMIILSSDRPPELRETGGHQTIDQINLFPNYLRWQFDIPCPTKEISPRFALTTVDQAVQRATGHNPGPVHLNCMFREPLSPVGETKDWDEYLANVDTWRKGNSPYTTYTSGDTRIGKSNLSELSARINDSKRGLILCGALDNHQDKSQIFKLAEALNWPVIADINSGLRFGNNSSATICTKYNFYLRSDKFLESYRPDFVLQFGATPISSAVLKYLNLSNAYHVVVDESPRRIDPGHRVSRRIESPPASLANELLQSHQVASSELLTAFQNAESVVSEAIEIHFKDTVDIPSELGSVRALFHGSTTPRGIYLATSMPIRHADSLSGTSNTSLHICANRGVNGIDGTIASAVGFAAGIKLPTTLLIGDLAFLHDSNSLLLVKNSEFPIVIVVLNNDGGSIFSFLPVAEIGDKFEPFFGTPHGLKFPHLAAQFEIAYYEAGSTKDFVKCYKDSLLMNKSAIIEVASDRKLSFDQHSQLWRDVIIAVESKLKSE